jgi:hypothetical protein
MRADELGASGGTAITHITKQKYSICNRNSKLVLVPLVYNRASLGFRIEYYNSKG